VESYHQAELKNTMKKSNSNIINKVNKIMVTTKMGIMKIMRIIKLLAEIKTGKKRVVQNEVIFDLAFIIL
jgi:hypothetical protein